MERESQDWLERWLEDTAWKRRLLEIFFGFFITFLLAFASRLFVNGLFWLERLSPDREGAARAEPFLGLIDRASWVFIMVFFLALAARPVLAPVTFGAARQATTRTSRATSPPARRGG